jgi:hypothetical protein
MEAHKSDRFGKWKTGLVRYVYDVPGAVEYSGLYNGVEPKIYRWGFKLRKVGVRLPTGGGAGVAALANAGTLQPSKMEMRKEIFLKAPGGRFLGTQDNEWTIEIDDKNAVSGAWRRGGIFLEMDDEDDWARSAVANAWAGSNGLPPDVDTFEALS